MVPAEVDEAVGLGCHPTAIAAFATRLHLTKAVSPVSGPAEALGGVEVVQQLVVLRMLERQDHDADVLSHPAPVTEGAPEEHTGPSRPADVAHPGFHAGMSVAPPPVQAMDAMEQHRCTNNAVIFEMLPQRIHVDMWRQRQGNLGHYAKVILDIALSGMMQKTKEHSRSRGKSGKFCET